MNLALAVFANIAVFVGPYIFILITLGNQAKEYNVSLITLCKYEEVKSLFIITLCMQFMFLILGAEVLFGTVFIDNKPIGTLVDTLYTAAESMGTLEFIFGVIFIVTESVSVGIRFDKELQKQNDKSIKF